MRGTRALRKRSLKGCRWSSGIFRGWSARAMETRTRYIRAHTCAARFMLHANIPCLAIRPRRIKYISVRVRSRDVFTLVQSNTVIEQKRCTRSGCSLRRYECSSCNLRASVCFITRDNRDRLGSQRRAIRFSLTRAYCALRPTPRARAQVCIDFRPK